LAEALQAGRRLDGGCHNNGVLAMSVLKRGLAGIVLCLAIVSTPLLIFILIGMWLFR